MTICISIFLLFGLIVMSVGFILLGILAWHEEKQNSKKATYFIHDINIKKITIFYSDGSRQVLEYNK